MLADADLERAANAAVYYSMQNAGQTCISIERVYVEEPVYDEFVRRRSPRRSRALRQGEPAGPGAVDVGAITFPPQLDIVEDHVDGRRRSKGARVLAGGQRAQGGGRFFEPTVLVDVDHTMKCMTEETFGPTLPIMKVRDADEAVRLANDSPYGLGASVLTKDTARGEAIARRIEAGAVERQRRDDQLHRRSSCRWAAGRRPASARATARGGIRKYSRQQAILVTRARARRRNCTCSPTRRARRACWAGS